MLNDFYRSLFGESRKTPYPTAEVERVCAEIGVSADGRSHRSILAIRSHERPSFRNVRGVEEPRMTRWWSSEIRGELQDQWCAALDGSPITTEMAESVPDEFRDHGAGDWVRLPAGGASGEGWLMRADFQAFVASQCARR